MGRDKALIEVGGLPLAAIVAGALRAAGADPVAAVGGNAHRLAPLGLEVVADAHPGEGPLGGVCTALRWAPTPVVAVLGCDLPSARAAAVAGVVEALAGSTADVALPVVDGRRAFVHGAWRRSALAHLEAAFAQGHRSLADGVAALHVLDVEGLDPRWLADVDVPDDLERATLDP